MFLLAAVTLGRLADVLRAHVTPLVARGVTAAYPGHLKWDYEYSIGRLDPDVIIQLWLKPEEAAPYIDGRYVVSRMFNLDIRLKQGSERIRWDGVAVAAP